MTDPAHAHSWTATPVLDTDAVTIIETADHLEQRERKATHFVSVEDRLDEVMRQRLHDLINTSR